MHTKPDVVWIIFEFEKPCFFFKEHMSTLLDWYREFMFIPSDKVLAMLFICDLFRLGKVEFVFTDAIY